METKTTGVVIIKDGEVLLVEHLQGGNNINGTYGLPAGRLEPNEEYIDAAIRELKEETGLVARTDDLKLLPIEYHALVERKDGEEAMVMKVFLCLKYEGTLQNSSETAPKWLKLNEFESLKMNPNVANAVRQAIEFKDKMSL